MLDAWAMALMFGVQPEDFKALPLVDGATRVPRHWIKRGRRRTREAAAATGSDFLLDILAFWAMKDHGATLKVVYQ
ncbi:hypothetical protein NWT09_14095 [Mycolicibacterium sp. jd]|uniref:hypothetical protein n=1 Tax=unclassified Mycolicibacterium TaxID=2636767 RepID=UPI00351BC457